jgi:glycosyltransferase involved in cell wall biosynthesis
VTAVFVLWQSLVVSGYRSFFDHLARLGACRVALAAPARFREAGNQEVACAPFTGPLPGFVLPATAWHVQAVWFHGLRRAMRAVFAGAERRIFLCIAEPYSLTALLAWLVAPRCEFVLYAAQNIVKKQPLPLRLIQALMFRRAAAILVVGAEQEQVLRTLGYRGRTIAFPLWYDRTRFHPGQRPHRSVVGYAGGLTDAKGVRDLLAAMKLMPDASYRIAGAGPLQADVERACRELPDAKYLGALPLDAMPDFYRGLDVLVVPSRTTPAWKEQFGRVIIEAMACGVVVLGSRSGEIPRVIGDDGRLFDEGDPQDLARVLKANLTAEGADASRYTDEVLAGALAEALDLNSVPGKG